MAANDQDGRIFVGGLSWDTNERSLERAFSRFGKVVETQVVKERETGRSRGFGFVTFSDSRAVDSAISEMHNGELDGRTISVNKAQPKANTDDGHRYESAGYSSGSRGGYRSAGGDVPPPVARDECFKCGRVGHWARECPSAGTGTRGGRLSPPPSRFERDGRSDRFGAPPDRYGDRYVDEQYDGGRYGERDRVDNRFGAPRDHYASERYPPSGDRYAGDRYGGVDRYPQNGYSKERSYERESGSYYRNAPRVGYDRAAVRGGGGGDRYGRGGPARQYGGNFRERPGPYDRPARGQGYDDRY